MSPNTELANMNNAAVPLAPFVVVHPANMISGERNIPPPVPVKPARKPITPPVKTA
jgi:hypothetical protein